MLSTELFTSVKSGWKGPYLPGAARTIVWAFKSLGAAQGDLSRAIDLKVDGAEGNVRFHADSEAGSWYVGLKQRISFRY